jgi:hypothetical protein
LIKYKDKEIYIVVPHYYESGKFFIRNGVIKEIHDDYLILSTSQGENLISFDLIREIIVRPSGINRGDIFE